MKHLMAAASACALVVASGAYAQTTGTSGPLQATPPMPPSVPEPTNAVGEIIVTAQKRSENIQTVPIAISAFDGSTLLAERIDGGKDLAKYVPNFSFTRTNYGDSNFEIRGIGNQLVSTTADPGVQIAENNAPLVISRIADAEFFDLERVEVLRGPQGTLFGRNATGGVVNLITAKPTDVRSGSVSAEVGTYDTRKFRAYFNTPLADGIDLRVAGVYVNHSGYQDNAYDNGTVDGRDLYSTRATLLFKPSASLRASLMWEHFQEDDDRTGGYQTPCRNDPGPSQIGGVTVQSALARNLLSRGCLPGSVYGSQATGLPNSTATLAGFLALAGGFAGANDLSAAAPALPSDLRTVREALQPSYKARNDLFEFNIEYDLTPSLKVVALSSWSEDHLRNFNDLSANSSPTSYQQTAFLTGGIVADPQIGSFNTFQDYLYNDNYAQQFSQEVRVQSSFSGPVNFSVGGLYYHLKRTTNSIIGNNAVTEYASLANSQGSGIYIDPGPGFNNDGHNYFNSRTPYDLESKAGFGELYVQLAPELKLTAGFRFTEDSKSQDLLPITLLSPGVGFPSGITQKVKFEVPTGRVNLDWTPRVAFTDRTLLYASYSRGYKAGGFNPPDLTQTSPSYSPEFVNAFEIGTKNTLAHRTVLLNLNGFYYDYSNYQISQVVGLTAQTSNVDVVTKGAELESVWTPRSDIRFNGTLGYLDTRISTGSSINPFNRTQGDATLTRLNSTGTACVAPTADVAKLVSAINLGIVPAAILYTTCPTAANPTGAYSSPNPAINPLAALGISLPTSSGIPVNFDGNQLPNAPHLTVALGAEYRLPLGGGWNALARGDFAYRSQYYATFYNDPSDRLHSNENLNLSLTVSNPQAKLQFQLYAENVANATIINGVGVSSDSVGLQRTAYLNDPRVVGFVATKGF